jgi:hypothetical protein
MKTSKRQSLRDLIIGKLDLAPGKFTFASSNVTRSKRVVSIVKTPQDIGSCKEEDWVSLPVKRRKLGSAEFYLISNWMKKNTDFLDILGHDKFVFRLEQFRFKVQPADINAGKRFYICLEKRDSVWKVIMNHVSYVQNSPEKFYLLYKKD